jgi:hypothetical protein
MQVIFLFKQRRFLNNTRKHLIHLLKLPGFPRIPFSYVRELSLCLLEFSLDTIEACSMLALLISPVHLAILSIPAVPHVNKSQRMEHYGDIIV